MKLRVLHILASAHPGGAERMSLNLAAYLQRAGHEVIVHAFVEGTSAATARRLGLQLTVPPPSGRAGRSRGAYWHWLGLGLAESIREFRPQVVHSHVPLSNLICHRLNGRVGVPWIATAHGSWRQFAYSPLTSGKPWLRPYLLVRHAIGDALTLRSAARVIAISDYVAGELRALHIPSSRISRIYNGMDPVLTSLTREEVRANRGYSVDDLVIGSLGYLTAVKGFDILIRGFALVASRFPHARLSIAGGGVLGDSKIASELMRLARSEGVADRVEFTGSLSETTDWFRALDIFAVTSRTEGFSLALVEAMFNRLPSVVTSAGGCVEVARPEMEGLVYRSPDHRDLARTIRILIDDHGLREKLGREAAARANSEFTLERCGLQYERLYEELLARR